MNNFNTGKQIQFVCYEMNQTSFKHKKKDVKTDFPITFQINQYKSNAGHLKLCRL